MKLLLYVCALVICAGHLCAQEEEQGIDLSIFENDARKHMKAPAVSAFPYLKECIDPVFGTSVTRITDSAPKEKIRHDYSELQAWNADETKLLMNGDIYDAKTYALLEDLPYMQGAKWCPINPDILYFTDAYDLKTKNIQSGEIAIVYTFKEKIMREASMQELSNDGTRVAVATRGDDGKPVIYAFDVKNKKVLGRMASYQGGLDWVGISPSGKYVVINTGRSGSKSNKGYGIEGYDVELTYKGKIWTGRPHCDMIMDNQGKEWFIGFTFDDYGMGFGSPHVIKSRIPDGVDKYAAGDKTAMVPLLKVHWKHGGHVSCRNIKNPTFCVVSAQGVDVDAPLVQETYLLDLNSTVEKPLIARVLHHQSSRLQCPVDSMQYWCEVHASSNHDGSKFIFASKLMTGDHVNAFVVDLSKGVKK